MKPLPNMPAHAGKMRPYKAVVTGEQDGVPFRVQFKRMDAAYRVAIDTGGTLTFIDSPSDPWREVSSIKWNSKAEKWVAVR